MQCIAFIHYWAEFPMYHIHATMYLNNIRVTWHNHRFSEILYKYDGFVYKNLGRTLLNQEQPKKDREQFFQLHFPLWRGFIVSSYDDKLELVEALERLHLLHLSQGVPEMRTSYGRVSSIEKVDLNQLDLGKVWAYCIQ